MNDILTRKLKDVPKTPGVYFHKNAKGQIIYVGKAAVLRNRVRQYFQASRSRDPKTEALVAEIADVDWMEVETELDALFLEGELIRRYMPPYNILLRDDKSFVYIRIDEASDYPTVTTTRRPLDDGAKYFGPYLSVMSVRQALKLLRRVFPFAVRRVQGQKRASLYYHLGLDPGLEDGHTNLEDYRANLRRLIAVIDGKRKNIERELEKNMKQFAKNSQFEEAANARNQLFALRRLNHQVIFSDKEFLDISKDHALSELVELLGLEKFPRRIEGYDISHMSGTDVVASMVVFENGVTNKGEYRKFKTKINQNDDFYNMNETIKRRLSDKNLKAWGKPDLMLIDGGKGQLDAAIRARDAAANVQGSTLYIPIIGLAKREEQIVIQKKKVSKEQRAKSGEGALEPIISLNDEVLHKLGGFKTESDDFILINLPHSTNLIKLLQRIRDESHRFAVSYHSVLKVKRQTASMLDEIPTIGPSTRKKLILTFGSMRGLLQAREMEIEKTIGVKKAAILKQYLKPIRQESKR
ncbi:MAG: excinuclease ABC subunit UvrC [Patescibacteria group bacterium]